MVVRAVQKAMVARMAWQAMLELLVAVVPMESLDMVALVTHMASVVQLQLLLLLLQGLHLAAKGEAESPPPQPEGQGSKSINCIL